MHRSLGDGVWFIIAKHEYNRYVALKKEIRFILDALQTFYCPPNRNAPPIFIGLLTIFLPYVRSRFAPACPFGHCGAKGATNSFYPCLDIHGIN